MNTFPKISFITLARLRDIAELPAKKAKSPNALGAWRLAKRMKEHQANASKSAKAGMSPLDLSKTRDWQNVVEFLNSAVAQGKFDVLDEWALAWNAWEIKADVIAADSSNGLMIQSGNSVSNKKTRPVTRAVVDSIMKLQRNAQSPDRAPSFQEILADLAKSEFSIDETELSRQIKKLGLQGMIPDQSDLGVRNERAQKTSGVSEKTARKRAVKKTS